MISLYGGESSDSIDDLRARKFFTKVASSKISVKVQSLPPTSAATSYHSLRVYLQVQQWIGKGNDKNPTDWGWQVASDKIVPTKTNLQPAPELLLKVIRCSCKTNCDSKRCNCRKHGLECSPGCGECRGTSCTNSPAACCDSDDDGIELHETL